MGNIIKILIEHYYVVIKLYILYFTPALIMMLILGDYYIGKKRKVKSFSNLIFNYFIISGFIAVIFQFVYKMAMLAGMVNNIRMDIILMESFVLLHSFARDTYLVKSFVLMYGFTAILALIVRLLWSKGIRFSFTFRRNRNVRLKLLTPAVFAVCMFFINVIRFIKEFFGSVTIESIIFQMTTTWDGTGEIHTFIKGSLRYILSFAVVSLLVFIVVNAGAFSAELSTSESSKALSVDKKARRAIAVFILVFTVIYAESNLKLIKFISNNIEKSTLYEEYYVDKDSVNIVFPEKKRNLVMIYLESMEVAYAETEKESVIPHLAELAETEISFSNTDKLGGFYEAYGCKWTMGGLLGSSSGTPYNIPLGRNAMEYFAEFMPGLDTTLGEVLESEGYKNVFMCGSDIEFGGRGKYYSQHGNYELMDYYTAIDDGYIDRDYRVWWGHEDEILINRAKDKILQLSQEDRPFNFTMLTVDTHFEDGYECNICEDDYKQQYSNVIKCSDRQIYGFIEWLKQQDFYENTTVVLLGDHTSMDTDYLNDIEGVRTVYNCFVNSAAEGEPVTKIRLVTTLDIFPSVLAAMGVEIEGDRLALGTNLFSERQTLAEELGLEYFQEEMAKSSEYYNGFLQ